MKAILEFDLNDPSDEKSHRRACRSTNAYLVIHTLYESIRNKIKYSEEESISYEDLREHLNETCSYYGVTMDDLE